MNPRPYVFLRQSRKHGAGRAQDKGTPPRVFTVEEITAILRKLSRSRLRRTLP